MEEKNNKETPTSGTEKKAFWIIGIALIIFLIILFGSLIGLKITRDGLNNVIKNHGKNSGEINNLVQNYEELENGVKINTSEEVRNAEFVKDGIRLSHFNIDEIDGFSTVSASIENMTQEVIKDITIVVKMYDSNNTVLAEFSAVTSSIEPENMEMINSQIMKSCANTAKVEADIIVAGSILGE